MVWSEDNSKKIGGRGCIVEIDESMFTKREYHCWRNRSGNWVFWCVCRETGECFLSIVPNCGEKTLLPILEKYIETESIILLDCWKGNLNIDKLESNYDH